MSHRPMWVASVIALLACSARAAPMPRVASYAALRSSGAPLVLANGRLDLALIAGLARHRLVTLDVAALMARPDIAMAVRRANPECRILGYHLVTHWWLGPDFDPQRADRSWNAEWHRAIVATGGFVRGAPTGYEVDWRKRATADTLTNLLCRAVSSLRLSGVFLDFLSPTLEWGGMPGDSARLVHMERLVTRLREAGGPGFRIMGNGIGADRLGVDGTMREGFPAPHTTFEQAMTLREGDWLKAEGGRSGPHTPDAMQQARYVLGVACLTGAWASFSPDRDLSVQPSYLGWYPDEASVAVRPEPSGSAPDSTGAHSGWLGEPVGAARVLGHASERRAVWRRDFANGTVLVNPSSDTLRVEMNAPFRRLHGRDRLINNGIVDSVFQVPPNDALFLIARPR